jgi:hypothetical protein
MKTWQLWNSHVESAKGVTTSNFADDETVVLAESLGISTGVRCPVRQCVDRDLSSLVNTDSVDIVSLFYWNGVWTVGVSSAIATGSLAISGVCVQALSSS